MELKVSFKKEIKLGFRFGLREHNNESAFDQNIVMSQFHLEFTTQNFYYNEMIIYLYTWKQTLTVQDRLRDP